MTKPKKFVFVLMPFDPSFDDVYYGIKQSCKDVDAYCERVDEQIFHERILDRIYNQISKADIIVADMTGRNANVFYEVGYAHALGKQVILLINESEEIAFDLKHFPHIIYNGQIKSLGEQLKRKLEWFLSEEPSVDKSSSDFGLDFLINGESIQEGKNILINENQKEHYNTYYTIQIDIHNSHAKAFSSKFKVGLETDMEYKGTITGLELVTPSVDKILFVSKDLSNIYPGAYKKISFNLENIVLKKRADVSIPLKLKIFTSFDVKEKNFLLSFPKYEVPITWDL